jgi:adenine-specific DNA-methyltransferase
VDNKQNIEKLDMSTPNITDDNVARIADLFPNVVTEGRDENGKLTHVVDFDALKQELSDSIVEGPQERYRLDWPGKREAMLAANTPITKTLRPVREESVDFDSTKNLFIEGDNLDALKLLQETYLGKVKMIYIDPPYNTGKDFIYKDNFTGDKQEYLEYSGQVDEEGGRLVANPESNGRYHSDWLSMMYPRLKLARNLLRDDGVIFISIDNSEHAALKKICDEIFGESNFMGDVCRATGQTTGQDSGGLGSSFDFLLVYGKDSESDLSGLPLTQKDIGRFKNQDERGNYAFDQMRKTGSNDRRSDRPKLFYPVKSPDGEDVFPVAPAGYDSCWRFEEKTYKRLLADDYILWKKTKRGNEEVWWPYVKYYLEGRTKRPSPLWTDLEGNKKAARDVRALFDGKKVFDFPKPLQMISRCIQIVPNASSDDIIVDFFSGSASTAHAVMNLNATEKANRVCISVQLPEQVDEETEAGKLGYPNIAEISKERIRRAGKKILGENPDQVGKLDVGFRVLKIDSSNMNDVYYAPGELDQGSLLDSVEHIKPERTSEDLLFQVMLDWGVDLSLPIVREQIDGKTVFWVGDDDLAACFDLKISEDIVKTMAERKPLRAVFRDDGFGSDDMKINAGQLFAQMTDGHTDMKVI